MNTGGSKARFSNDCFMIFFGALVRSLLNFRLGSHALPAL